MAHNHFCAALVANLVAFFVGQIVSAALFCGTLDKLHKARIERSDKFLPLLLAVRNLIQCAFQTSGKVKVHYIGEILFHVFAHRLAQLRGDD